MQSFARGGRDLWHGSRRQFPFSLPLPLCLGLLLLQPSFGQVNHIEAAARLLSEGRTSQSESEARLALKTPATRALALSLLGTIRLQQGKYPESIDYLNRALAMNPNLVGARTTLGEAYVLQGNPDAATTAFREALKRDPTNVNARFDWARLESSRRNFAKSLELAGPILSPLGETEEGLLLLATNYAALGKKDELSLLTTKWERLSGASDNASMDFAGLLANQGLTAQAAEILQKTDAMVAAHPSTPAALRLAQAYLALGNLERAQSNALLALSVNSGCAACYLTAAQIAERQGLSEKALSYLVQAKKLQPDNPEVLFEFGRVCLMRNLLEDAMPALERAVELQPDHDQYVYVLASANVGKGNLPKAAALIGGLVKKHPRDPILNYAMGAVYYLQSNYSDAENSLKQSLAIQPDQIAASYYLALTYDALREDDKALGLLREVLSKHPDHAPSLLELGTILSRQGQYAEAEQDLKRAVSLDPGSPGAHYRLGVVLGKLGKTAEAEQEFAQSRKVHEDKESQSHLHMRLLLPE
jgi:tetratricopeptide (TPR) repeat protein